MEVEVTDDGAMRVATAADAPRCPTWVADRPGGEALTLDASHSPFPSRPAELAEDAASRSLAPGPASLTAEPEERGTSMLMRRIATALAVVSLMVALAGPTGTASAASAAPAPPAAVGTTVASAAAPLCVIPTVFCVWSGTNFTGTKRGMPAHRNGICYQFSQAVRSYVDYGAYEGYFYATRECTGRARAVTKNTQSANIGYAAWSFRYACVSC